MTKTSDATGAVSISVVCAVEDRAAEVQLEVPAGTDIRTAVRLSGIADALPKLDPALDIESLALGIYGKLVAKEDEPHTEVQAGDRIEIYRPLIRDARQLGVSKL